MGGRRLAILVAGVLATACIDPPASADDDEEVGDESTTSSGGEEGCGGFEIVPTIVPPSNAMLVVDVSTSMNATWDDDDDPQTPAVTRWRSARTLVDVLLTELEGRVAFGLQRFPAADACLVADYPEVPIGPHQGWLIDQALPPADADALEIVGGSPATAAFLAAREHLPEPWGDQPPNGIVLITDGGANCGMGRAESLAMHVAEAFEIDGIRTFVVGVDLGASEEPAAEDSPQVDAAMTLEAIAIAGGTSAPYDVRDALSLVDALRFDQTADDCILDLTTLPEKAPEPEQVPFVSIEFNGHDLPLVDDCANVDEGWSWVVEGESLTFCGYRCQQFQQGAYVTGTYGCAP